jgi:hypothetical protein
MNTKNILVTALLVSVAGLSAVSISASADDNVAPGKTRAEVQAELIQAHSGNWSPANDEGFNPQAYVSTRKRAEVKAELLKARASGWHTKKENDSFTQKSAGGGRTRAEVQAELLQARAQEAASGHHVYPEN